MVRVKKLQLSEQHYADYSTKIDGRTTYSA